MDRIESQVAFQPFLPTRPEDRKSKKAASSKRSSFVSALTKAHEADVAKATASESLNLTDTDIERLLDEVQESGRHLAAYPGPENVQAYKERVRRFIKLVLDRSVALTEVEGRLRKDMKKPKYLLLQVIDEKLEKLGAYILKEQRDKLEILRRVDELHGLLIDLRH
ncbi:MAG: YaaR family protein [Spirochaetales bacterium]|nr:YaaR family protein [Spirochaetales bacterium]